MVIAPASTGIARRSKMVVIKMDQANRGISSNFIPSVRIFKVVDMKLIAPKIELAPARCKEKIIKSIELLLCVMLLDRGG